MDRRLGLGLLAAAGLLALPPRLDADANPPPSLSPYAVYPPFSGAGINQPFPDAVYGADHGGSTLALSYPFVSRFGDTDHAHGVVIYRCAPFTPRGSEGVYGMDVWLEQQDSSGNWAPAALNGGVPDQGSTYQPINTPNPGPSPAYTLTWTYAANALPANTALRVFIYVYLYNQGGGHQGNFYVASAIGPVNTGSANDPPRIRWSPSTGAVNPSQVQTGQAYVISVDGQDDNGNLATVCINRDGQPFAYAGGGDGYSGNSQNPSSDPAGSMTYTAWATDAAGASSPTISWTVTDLGRSAQPPVFSSDATLVYGSGLFTPFYGGGSGTGAWQFAIAGYTSWTVAADSNSGTELWPGNEWSADWMPPAPGTYAFWVARDGDADTLPSSPAGLYTLTVTAPPPPTATLTASPSSGTAPLAATIAWSTTGVVSVSVSGAGLSSASLSGTAAVALSSAGTFVYVLSASGPGGQASQSATVTVSAPAQPQTISFTPPATTLFPGPSLLLGATSTSGLPVGFVISGGPGSVQGNQLLVTGVGPIVIQAVQPGNGSWLPAASVTQTIQAIAAPAVVRVRFDSTGTDARVSGRGTHGRAVIRTDPSGLSRSPWPSFSNPAPLVPSTGAFPLPAIPAAPPIP
jgi:hypothetical protein